MFSESNESNWNMFIGFWALVMVLVEFTLGIIFVFPSYCKGYKQGQLDYQKGIIKYEIQEVTTDVIRRVK